MAKLVLSVLLVAVVLVALQDVCFAEEAVAEYKPTANSVLQLRRLLTIDCPSSCGNRCSEAGRQKRCVQFCMTCCKQCQCVPPGTYGNKQACPCYANLKNSKGADKCP